MLMPLIDMMTTGINSFLVSAVPQWLLTCHFTQWGVTDVGWGLEN